MSSHKPSPTRRRPRFGTGLEQLEGREVPAVIALTDFYRANVGQVIEVPASQGLLANDFSDINAGAVLSATLDTDSVQLFVFDANGDNLADPSATPLPVNSLTVNPDGSFRFVVPSNLPITIESLVFTYTAANANDPLEVPGTGIVNIQIGQPTPARFAVAPQRGSEPRVNVYEVGTGNLVQSFLAYEPGFTGGVRVAVADLNSDGVPDVITAPGEGGADRIKVFDGRTTRVLLDTFAFGGGFTGGSYVAAGDVNDDSFIDLIVGAGVGGGPRVVVYNGQGFSPFTLTNTQNVNPFNPGPQVLGGTFRFNGDSRLMDFFAYEPEFRGGVKVAAGDVAGVGRDFIITAPGFGGGPVVKTFDYNRVVGPVSVISTPGNANNGASFQQPINSVALNANGSAAANLSFLAGDALTRRGVNIGTGDVNGDGLTEILTGTAAGPAVVTVFNGTTGGILSQFGVLYEAVPTINRQNDALLGNAQPPTGILRGPTNTPTSLVPSQVRGGTGSLPIIPTNLPNLADGGVTVAGFDYDGDGDDEILTGAGPGNAPRVRVFSPDGTQITNFLAYPTNILNGINVGGFSEIRY